MNIDEAIAKYFKLANNDRCCQKEEAYQLVEYLTQLKEYKQLEKQDRLIKLPTTESNNDHRECVHTRAECHHKEYKCSECPLTELFCDEFYVAIDRCYENAYARGCLADIELGKSEFFFNADEMSEALQMAIQAIEKQIPKMIVGNVLFPIHIGDTVRGLCPNCMSEFVCIIPKFYKANGLGYCKSCGQKLDWREDNEAD